MYFVTLDTQDIVGYKAIRVDIISIFMQIRLVGCVGWLLAVLAVLVGCVGWLLAVLAVLVGCIGRLCLLAVSCVCWLCWLCWL